MFFHLYLFYTKVMYKYDVQGNKNAQNTNIF